MAQYNSNAIPEFQGVYVLALRDIAGTVAANNLIAMFNPIGSGVVHVALLLDVGSYSIGASSTPNSFNGHRITAASGGTQVSGSVIDRFDTTMPDPKTNMFSGNPTVTLDKYRSNYVTEPPFSVGAGGGLTQSNNTVPGASFVLYEGQGLAFGTTAGNTNQVWNVEYIWGEVAL